MNWSAIAAVLSALSFFAVVIGVAYVYGKLTQSVASVIEVTKTHDVRLGTVEKAVGEHAVDLGRLHEWKDGFNAGSRSSGGPNGN